MSDEPETVSCSLCGMPRPAEQIRWFVPDASPDQTSILSWPETSAGDPNGVPYCAMCLAEQTVDG